jgi:hypothetical protein
MKMATRALILSLILLLNFSIDLFAKEMDLKIGIVLVAVGEVDPKVIQILKDDLNKVFGKQVWVGKGMPEPHYTAIVTYEVEAYTYNSSLRDNHGGY